MDECFTKVPSWIFHSGDFLSREKLVFTALCMLQDSNGRCYPSVQEIANISSLSKAPVFEALKGLEEKGAIAKDKRFHNGSQTTSLYTVNSARDPNASKPPPKRFSDLSDSEIEAWANKVAEEIAADRENASTPPPRP